MGEHQRDGVPGEERSDAKQPATGTPRFGGEVRPDDVVDEHDSVSEAGLGAGEGDPSGEGGEEPPPGSATS